MAKHVQQLPLVTDRVSSDCAGRYVVGRRRKIAAATAAVRLRIALPATHANLHSCGAMAVILMLLAVPGAGASTIAVPNTLTSVEKMAGWQLLFDGKTTAGWRNYRGQRISNGWQVREGALTRVAASAGDIITDAQYDHFELSVEYRIAQGGNSGLMFHVTEALERPWQSGPEVQILDGPNGESQRAGWLYGLYRPTKPAWAPRAEKQAGFQGPELVDATRPAGQWNQIYLRVAEGQGEVAVNGVHYFNFRIGSQDWQQRVAGSKFAAYAGFGQAGKGHICLQDHGDPIAFRNIKLRPLSAQGEAPDPVHGSLPVKVVNAFPQLKWEGWDGADEAGRVRPLRPVELTHANDGSNRIFVATQLGRIFVLPNDPAAQRARRFLDITARVRDWQQYNEAGLLGLAFHPNFGKNGQFFLYYSSATEPHTSIVSRFQVSASDPNLADPGSEQLVMKIPQPFPNHNGGSIAFGPDGYLYIGLGDGGHRNDPLGHGQNLQTLLGSILRIDVDRADNGRAYGIPADNPFVDHADARPEIYAYGLRNVWRLAFDRKTGALLAADVGQDLWEEINVIRPGGNYGWNYREGSQRFGAGDPPQPAALIDPVWQYDHRVGKSISGGRVYRGSAVPQLDGDYLYADYVSGKIWALKYDQRDGVVENFRIPAARLPVTAFGEDTEGEVYILVQSGSGRCIYRLAPDD